MWIRWIRAALVGSVFTLSTVLPVSAQDGPLSIPPPVLTINQDRLFAETRLGARTSAEFESNARELAAENEEIERGLIARELELTEMRPTLPVDEFKVLADAFDAEVQQIRAEQDEKARALSRSRETMRQEFFAEVADIIAGIVRERGAIIVLDRREVFLSADGIDITDEAIARVNALGDQ